MADASCSGGTPFKRLIDHQARDVSHHQDRLTDRAGPQGHASFRSTPQHMQGADGFGAFMDGQSTLPGVPQHHHAAGRLAAHAAVLEQGHPHAFHAAQAQHFNQAQHSPSVDTSNWAADFSRFANQSQQQPVQNGFSQAAPQMHQPAPQMNFHTAFMQPNTAFSPMYNRSNGALMDNTAAPAQEPGFDDEMSKWMATNGGGGMEEVDAMMDKMARELELNDAAVAQAEAERASQQETIVEPRLEPNPLKLVTDDISNLAIEAEREAILQEPEPEPVEVAKTKSEVADAAERLLESVEHEDGEKWKNSVFLSLMRDFRDGRKDIIDNEIRETPENETNIAQDAQ